MSSRPRNRLALQLELYAMSTNGQIEFEKVVDKPGYSSTKTELVNGDSITTVNEKSHLRINVNEPIFTASVGRIKGT